MEVTFDPRTDCVFATVTGPVSPEGLLKAFSEACDKALERGSARILADLSELEGNLSASDRFKVGEGAAAQSLGRKWRVRPKVALVGKAPLMDGFGAMVALSRGLNVKTFSEVSQALDWLGAPEDLVFG